LGSSGWSCCSSSCTFSAVARHAIELPPGIEFGETTWAGCAGDKRREYSREPGVHPRIIVG
jgi:hypothetical protein